VGSPHIRSPDGAAGSIFEAVSKLSCSIDQNEVKQACGGGAHRDYAPTTRVAYKQRGNTQA